MEQNEIQQPQSWRSKVKNSIIIFIEGFLVMAIGSIVICIPTTLFFGKIFQVDEFISENWNVWLFILCGMSVLFGLTSGMGNMMHNRTWFIGKYLKPPVP